MQKRYLVILPLTVLLLAGCNKKAATTDVNPEDAYKDANPTVAATVKASPASKPYTFKLATLQNSGQEGTATLIEEGGKVKVTLDLTTVVATGAAAKKTPAATSSAVATASALPAHIHVGLCPTPGAIKYPLTNVVNNKSVTILNVTMASLIAAGDLSINVHKSATELSKYIVCGDLVFPATGGADGKDATSSSKMTSGSPKASATVKATTKPAASTVPTTE